MKKGFIRLSAVVLSLILVMGMIPINIFALPEGNVAEVWVNGEMKKASASSFEEIWKEAVSLASKKTDKGEKAEVVFKLFADWNAENGSFGKGNGFKNGAVSVPKDKIITIDLNGFAIDRDLSEKQTPTRNGMVIYMEMGSSLTLKDSNPESIHKGKITDGVWYKDNSGTTEIKGGIITGGYNLSDGGAVYMEDKTNLVLEGGKIVGNRANDGGGVQIEGGTTKLQMSEKAEIIFRQGHHSCRR